MSGALDETIRSLVREVVREEVRAALDERTATVGRRNDSTAVGYLSTASAAKFAAVAPGTLRRWIKEGRLTARRAGRDYRIEKTELDRFMAHEGSAPEVSDRARKILGS